MKGSKGTIVYIGGFEMPDKNAAAHRVLSNAKIFQLLGYNVVFCGIDKSCKGQIRKMEKIDNFDSWPSPYPNDTKAWMEQLLNSSFVKNVIESYEDVKYLIGYNMHAAPLRKLLHYCHKHSIKLIADSTEWYENKFSLQPIKLLKYIDTAYVMRVLQKKVDGMIAISPYLAGFYAKSVKNIIVLPPLVDLKDEKWSSTSKKTSNCIEFVYSGNPGNLSSRASEKDKLYDIIGCFNSISSDKNFHYTIIGITKQQLLKAIPQSAEAVKSLGEKLSFAGRVSHRESIEALNNADYCIIIRDRSRKNMAGFPTKFVECVTSGIGIIANDVSNIKEYFPNDGKSVFLPNSNQENLNRAIEQAMALDLQEIRSSRQLNNLFDYRNYYSKIETFIRNV